MKKRRKRRHWQPRCGDDMTEHAEADKMHARVRKHQEIDPENARQTKIKRHNDESVQKIAAIFWTEKWSLEVRVCSSESLHCFLHRTHMSRTGRKCRRLAHYRSTPLKAKVFLSAMHEFFRAKNRKHRLNQERDIKMATAGKKTH